MNGSAVLWRKDLLCIEYCIVLFAFKASSRVNYRDTIRYRRIGIITWIEWETDVGIIQIRSNPYFQIDPFSRLMGHGFVHNGLSVMEEDLGDQPFQIWLNSVRILALSSDKIGPSIRGSFRISIMGPTDSNIL
jgi:hypothetical protein